MKLWGSQSACEKGVDSSLFTEYLTFNRAPTTHLTLAALLECNAEQVRRDHGACRTHSHVGQVLSNGRTQAYCLLGSEILQRKFSIELHQ